MVATLNAPPTAAPLKRSRAIPKTLIYETIDGVNYYYKGYKNVIKNNLEAESIMGYGLFQWMIIDIVTQFLKANLPKQYLALGGEGGFHLSHKNNLSLDMIILDRKDIDFGNLQNKYLTFAPKIVIEVDTKAEMPADITTDFYFHNKTQKMLDFGVSQVVWIFTNIKKIMVAEPNKPWFIVNWTDEIEILDVKLNLLQLLEKEGITNL
jgi:hypothetical protein